MDLMKFTLHQLHNVSPNYTCIVARLGNGDIYFTSLLVSYLQLKAQNSYKFRNIDEMQLEFNRDLMKWT